MRAKARKKIEATRLEAFFLSGFFFWFIFRRAVRKPNTTASRCSPVSMSLKRGGTNTCEEPEIIEFSTLTATRDFQVQMSAFDFSIFLSHSLDDPSRRVLCKKKQEFCFIFHSSGRVSVSVSGWGFFFIKISISRPLNPRFDCRYYDRKKNSASRGDAWA